MNKFENIVEMLIKNNITYTVRYNVGISYEIDITFDELGYMPIIKKVYDYTTGQLIG